MQESKGQHWPYEVARPHPCLAVWPLAWRWVCAPSSALRRAWIPAAAENCPHESHAQGWRVFSLRYGDSCVFTALKRCALECEQQAGESWFLPSISWPWPWAGCLRSLISTVKASSGSGCCEEVGRGCWVLDQGPRGCGHFMVTATTKHTLNEHCGFCSDPFIFLLIVFLKAHTCSFPPFPAHREPRGPENVLGRPVLHQWLCWGAWQPSSAVYFTSRCPAGLSPAFLPASCFVLRALP